MGMCKWCHDDDSNFTDWMFHGETNLLTLKDNSQLINRDYDGNGSDINIGIYMDFEIPCLKAYGSILGLSVWSKPVRIKYCPNCGRKLNQENANG